MSDQLDTEETQDELLAGAPAEEEEVSERETDSEAEESDTSEESGEDQGEDDGEDDKGKQSGYVEIKDPKVRERVNQLTREKWDERRKRESLEKRLQELEAKNQPSLEEVEAPDADLAIDDPKKFAEQQKRYSEYLTKKAEHEYQDKQRQEQSKAQQQQELDEKISNYTKRAQKLGIGMDDLKKASDQIGQVGVHDDVVSFILDDDDGPAITAHLGSNLEDLLAVAEASPLKAVAHIERMRAKIARKPKSSPPKPPTKVHGSRPSGKAQDGTIYE